MTTATLTKVSTSPITTAPVTIPVKTIPTTSVIAVISSLPTTPATTIITTASVITTYAAPTTEELLSASCFHPNWPIIADKTLIKLNVLDRTKCHGICQRIPECLAFAVESKSCILKLSDNLDNLQSASVTYKFLHRT